MSVRVKMTDHASWDQGALDGPRYHAIAQKSDNSLAGSVVHNPFGRLKLVSMREIAERN